MEQVVFVNESITLSSIFQVALVPLGDDIAIYLLRLELHVFPDWLLLFREFFWRLNFIQYNQKMFISGMIWSYLSASTGDVNILFPALKKRITNRGLRGDDCWLDLVAFVVT